MGHEASGHSAATMPGLVGSTLGTDVLNRLRSDIISCSMKPGQRLRFELLRAVYGVSFSPLREALSTLASEGLVIAEGQRGFRVAPVSKTDLDDLTNVRVLIECEALRLAIREGDDDWKVDVLASFHRMDRLQAGLGEQYFLSPEWTLKHAGFHTALANGSRSATLMGIRDNLFNRAQRYRRISSLYRPGTRAKEAEHRAIMEAALARDVSAATHLIELHLRHTAESVLLHAGDLLENN